MVFSDAWLAKTLEAVAIAQTTYEKTPLHKPWPKWEEKREEAVQIFIADNPSVVSS